jgi:hypothetical protein
MLRASKAFRRYERVSRFKFGGSVINNRRPQRFPDKHEFDAEEPLISSERLKIVSHCLVVTVPQSPANGMMLWRVLRPGSNRSHATSATSL